jgi:hypothetical protein
MYGIGQTKEFEMLKMRHSDTSLLRKIWKELAQNQ